MAYAKEVVGRRHEQDVLRYCMESPRAEFIAVYGRRRVGKTYLIKQYFKNKFDFYTSGIFGLDLKDQLENFRIQLELYSNRSIKTLSTWFEAFAELRKFLSEIKKKRIVVFIDELPWHDSPKSNFVRALEAFWNMWASEQNKLKLIVCGSSTTWMTNTLLGDKGGLHNRVTRRIKLSPFSLLETELYLKRNGFDWTRMTVLQSYMTIGGIPFYLSMMQPSLSLEQNINTLFFSEEGPLRDEYDFLFRSLFNEAVSYRRIVEVIATKLKGLTRSEILRELKLQENGHLSEILDNLCKCDFIRCYNAYGKKVKESMYQLTDMYVLFYLRFVKEYKGHDSEAWSKVKETVKTNWYGYAFEQTCLNHIPQIRSALRIDTLASDVSSWSYRSDEESAQIDLILDHGEGFVNLCEIKFSQTKFVIDKDYEERLRERAALFARVSKCGKSILQTFITPLGVKPGKHSSVVNSEVVLDDLIQSLPHPLQP